MNAKNNKRSFFLNALNELKESNGISGFSLINVVIFLLIQNNHVITFIVFFNSYKRMKYKPYKKIGGCFCKEVL
jgi:hypothetical protein